jgi:predicted AAA+ superfamily ATPase
VAANFIEDSPVVLLEGPRTDGKSTILGELAKACGGPIPNLDKLDIRVAVATVTRDELENASAPSY